MEEFSQAAGCLAEVAMREASVIDATERLYVMEVIGNRALNDRGRASFFSKMCAAAGGWHRNVRTDQPFPDFSGLALRRFYVSSNPLIWKETYAAAQSVLLGYAIWGRAFPWQKGLPERYEYYHNAPAPEAWKKTEQVTCSFRYPAQGRGLEFCR